jgi:hypothetical protein
MKLVEQLKLQEDVKVPYNVWRFFGINSQVILVRGNEASFGEDFGTKEELRKAIEFYVEQLGGKVTWKG